MIKLENYEVMGWEHAIRGMRNPMNSWAKSDSKLCRERATCDNCYFEGNVYGDKTTYPISCDEALGPAPKYSIGKNDHELMMKLANAGPVHGKFRRMITVYVDITAPLYWWKEFDTYKVGTVANSCSTMHKIHDKEFTLEDFSREHLLGLVYPNDEWTVPYIDVSIDKDGTIIFSPTGVIECIVIPMLNKCRKKYLETKDKKYWWQMIQLLPSSYNQKRTVQLNYEVLANIYTYRKNHKLDEWVEFCSWIEQLPYSEIITGEREKADE